VLALSVLEQMRVVGDQRVGGLENAGAAIVLFELMTLS
jgi:hypothetical protein